ncbi:hypothetical protein [Teredinibacter purpureus]|uniref:hypothetical protein n=1 Tax=Teredinibacter purpureus TaxID=2731756 RepID=UPI0005F884ED|nr:hypothetical protein [Teredinibacter purpureus]
MVQSCQVPENQNLRSNRVFYPQTNVHDAALYDIDRSVVIGLSNMAPYHPTGGSQATQQIVDAGGLVTGSEV